MPDDKAKAFYRDLSDLDFQKISKNRGTCPELATVDITP